jgi:glycosyltransferase A (GT-A) superfamily protein (DUF2064 family)
MTTAVIVFAKAPVPGLAKTRLAPALGADGAAALAARMLRHTLQQAVAAGIGPVELCAAPDAAHPALQAAAAACGAALAAQGDGSLGDRMHRAFERHLAPARAPAPGTSSKTACTATPAARGTAHRGALLIGTDAPALDAAMLQQAAAALREHDAVFVPALDGGYALVGLHRADARCFDGMHWSHAQVMADTRQRLRAAGLRWAELQPVADVDEPADLVHLPDGWLDEVQAAR